MRLIAPNAEFLPVGAEGKEKAIAGVTERLCYCRWQVETSRPPLWQPQVLWSADRGLCLGDSLAVPHLLRESFSSNVKRNLYVNTVVLFVLATCPTPPLSGT